MGKRSGSIRDEQPGSYFGELRKQFLGLKYLNFLMWIRDRKSSDPGSGIDKSRIRDKHSGSATLGLNINVCVVVFYCGASKTRNPSLYCRWKKSTNAFESKMRQSSLGIN
jgi:hypothetical protein